MPVRVPRIVLAWLLTAVALALLAGFIALLVITDGKILAFVFMPTLLGLAVWGLYVWIDEWVLARYRE
jgi:hypothetical protein